jgi:hypothetical protein
VVELAVELESVPELVELELVLELVELLGLVLELELELVELLEAAATVTCSFMPPLQWPVTEQM